jgi:16S rRNA (guanine527-N7)-methyltransferase
MDKATDPSMTWLDRGCHLLELPLNPRQLAQFESYYQDLVAWNQKFNLTAITDYQGVQTKHFLDCLTGARLLAEEWPRWSAAHSLSCVDVGSGAGFPGVPLKLVAPQHRWTLLDGTGKKITFLTQLIEHLGLTEINAIQGRAEEAGRQSEFRQRFDLVTARAVAPLNTLVEYLLPLASVGGFVMIYKGASAPQEFMLARKAIELLGGEMARFAPMQVPFLDEKRFILLIKKARPTPSIYPRGQGLSRKKPLE